MMHGIGDDPHVFDDLASLLHDRFRIIAYARRGHGLSDAPPGPMTRRRSLRISGNWSTTLASSA
jgi:pimeloyl-ACP methyl ester carboxylesterase